MNETMPPESENVPATPVPQTPMPPRPGEPAPPRPDRVKTDVPFLIIGIVTVLAAWTVLTFLANVLQNVWSGILTLGGFPLVFLAFLAMLLIGSARQNNRLKSFGKGGLFAYAAIPLIGLLLFGSCLIGGFPV